MRRTLGAWELKQRGMEVVREWVSWKKKKKSRTARGRAEKAAARKHQAQPLSPSLDPFGVG